MSNLTSFDNIANLPVAMTIDEESPSTTAWNHSNIYVPPVSNPTPISAPTPASSPLPAFQLSTTYTLAPVETETITALSIKCSEVQSWDMKIANDEAALRHAKRCREQAKLEVSALKKRKLACDQSLTIEQRTQVRQDQTRTAKVLDTLRNVRVEGECDQMKTRGKCRIRRGVVDRDGENFCKECWTFKLEGETGYR